MPPKQNRQRYKKRKRKNSTSQAKAKPIENQHISSCRYPCASPSSSAPSIGMPPEILHLISSYLDDSSVLSLGASCQSLHQFTVSCIAKPFLKNCITTKDDESIDDCNHVMFNWYRLKITQDFLKNHGFISIESKISCRSERGSDSFSCVEYAFTKEYRKLGRNPRNLIDGLYLRGFQNKHYEALNIENRKKKLARISYLCQKLISIGCFDHALNLGLSVCSKWGRKTFKEIPDVIRKYDGNTDHLVSRARNINDTRYRNYVLDIISKEILGNQNPNHLSQNHNAFDDLLLEDMSRDFCRYGNYGKALEVTGNISSEYERRVNVQALLETIGRVQ